MTDHIYRKYEGETPCPCCEKPLSVHTRAQLDDCHYMMSQGMALRVWRNTGGERTCQTERA